VGHHHHGKHGNPEDFDRYLERLEAPERAEWQKPDEVVAALKLSPRDVACEVGAGPGYFSLRMARAAAHVFAVEVEPRMLALLRTRLTDARLANVTPVLALDDDPLLPDACCDLVLFVNTFHHFSDGAAYLRRVSRALKPGGRIVNIDLHEGELPVGPPPEMKLSRDAFAKLAATAGLRIAREHTFLPYQYFLELQTPV
jgi:ubiquinone/menaquinone biosynthesis C-methylase UbiE